jgi:RNA polymerase sigma-70 factor (ECF subfamily)
VPPDASQSIERVIACGAAALPAIAATPAVRAYVAERIDNAGDSETRAVDLYLAGACTAGDPAAIAHVDSGLPALVRPALARLGMPASDDDEIIQRVRIALLSPNESGTRGIAGYTGRGDLRSYVRAVAVKLALKRRERESEPQAADDAQLLVPDPDDSPELRILKERCRGDLRAAFATALGELSARERTLLRQHYLDGLTVDALGKLHRVHRSTCARWIEAAREHVLRGVRSHLGAALALTPADLDSALALVRSQLDLSLARHLASR